jgi:hypothetical protein
MKDWMGVSSITTLDEFGFILATQLLLRRISLKLCRSNRLRRLRRSFRNASDSKFRAIRDSTSHQQLSPNTDHLVVPLTMISQRTTVFCFLVAVISTVGAFVTPSKRANHVANSQSCQNLQFTPAATSASFKRSSRLFDQPPGKKQVKADGTGRGAILLGVVLAACVWIFSIPPEFRRAYLCGTERCVQDRQAYLCNDCMTPEEWRTGIMEYYKNGGGVKFDFSVDPNNQFLIK